MRNSAGRVPPNRAGLYPSATRRSLAAGKIAGLARAGQRTYVRINRSPHLFSFEDVMAVVQDGFPINFSETPSKLYRLPPKLGKHSREILAELGIDAPKLDKLEREGVIICA